jgi:NADPH2:quinone reductase
MDIAVQHGADHVLPMDDTLAASVRMLASDGVDQIVEITFGENIALDLELLALGGSIAAYTTHAPTPQIPFCELLLNNVGIHVIGSDGMPDDIEMYAATALNRAIEGGWPVARIAGRFRLHHIAAVQEFVERGGLDERVVLMLQIS